MALSVSAASARVQSLVPQQSLRGLKIGMLANQVRAVAGNPNSNRITSHPIMGKTRVMKFVDDAEFWFDPASGVVHVRSASRVGRKDFGVNRARIEAVRQALAG